MSRRQNLYRPLFRLTALENRAVPASLATDLSSVSDDRLYAVGVDAGASGSAALLSADGSELFRVTPYGADFTGGVRVAVADVTGDGTDDLITAPGVGAAPTVNVYDGTDGTLFASFGAYESSFRGGVNVVAADLNGDDVAEIVTGADEGGGPRVIVFDGSTVSGTATPSALIDFLAIEDPNFRGGVRLGAGDINGDGVDDLLVGAGYGGGPRVAGFDGAQLAEGDAVKLFADFYAYEQGLRNGINVAVGDVNSDGKGDLIFGGGPGGGPRVRVCDGDGLVRRGGGGSLDDYDDELELENFFAGDEDSREGVRVGTTTGDDGSTDIVTLDVATGQLNAYQRGGNLGKSFGAPFGKGGFFAGGRGRGPGGGFGRESETGVAAEFLLTTSGGLYAGQETLITIRAVDDEGLRVADYEGSVTLTSTDGGADFPDAVQFIGDGRGVIQFAYTPSETGEATVTATAEDGSVVGTLTLDVTDAPVASRIAVDVIRAEVGEDTKVLIAVIGADGRPIQDFTGTVTLTTSDGAAELPATVTFAAADRGVKVVEVTFNTAGSQTVSASADGGLTGSDTVVVRAGDGFGDDDGGRRGRG